MHRCKICLNYKDEHENACDNCYNCYNRYLICEFKDYNEARKEINYNIKFQYFKYCKKHNCKEDRICKYCDDCKCQIPDCMSSHSYALQQCKKHTCTLPNCNRSNDGMEYSCCEKHKYYMLNI